MKSVMIVTNGNSLGKTGAGKYKSFYTKVIP
jgi:hypothetical protein